MMLSQQILEFFGLKRDPWEDGDVPSKELFFSKSFKTVEGMINEAAKRNAFLLVYGETGTGKSVLIQRVLKRLKSPRQIVAYISPLFNEAITQGYIASEIIANCGAKVPRVNRDKASKLIEVIAKTSKEKKNICVILDEVHLIKDAVLKALKRFHEGLGVHQSKISVVLIGQPEIIDILESSHLREVRNRISQIRLDPLNAAKDIDIEAVREYINLKIKYSGGDTQLFTPDAVEEIAGRVETLQQINEIASHAMHDAFIAGEKNITKEIVNELG